MDKPSPDATKEEVIAYLSTEYVKFDSKKDITFNLKTPITQVKFDVSWESKDEFDTYEDGYFEENLVCSVDDIEKQIKEEIKKLDDALKDFLKVCDSYAKKFGLDPQDFFEEIVDFVKKDKD